MAKPVFFISHKHSDTRIAEVLAKFIEARSMGEIQVYLSSNADFVGPRFGRNLNSQLREVLWNTDALALIYTEVDQDWQYCMWECGVATHPQSPGTHITVFQCGPDIPKPFEDVLRVNVFNPEDIKRFITQFHRSDDFFRTLNRPLAPNINNATIEGASKELQESFREVIHNEPSEEWPAWPYLEIALPISEIRRIRELVGEDDKVSHQIIKDHAVVIQSDPRVAQLFGLVNLPIKVKFDELLKSWQAQYSGEDADWFDSCCEQIATIYKRRAPIIKAAPFKEVGGDSQFTLVVSHIKILPFSGSVQFAIYFYDLEDPRAVLVTSRMVKKFFYRNIDDINTVSVSLKDLITEFSSHSVNRMPILNEYNHPIGVVHRSIVDRFISNRILSGANGVEDIQHLTLNDLVNDQKMADMLQRSFIVVSKRATLEEAKNMMLKVPGCWDVMVTDNGNLNEPIIGWLTNNNIYV